MDKKALLLEGFIMIVAVNNIDKNTIERLLALYSESMNHMLKFYSNKDKMITAYTSFCENFIKSPNHCILVEEVSGVWVSALRALETEQEKWFIEAVETKPDQRGKGYGKALLQHTIQYLQERNMKEVTCTIASKNVISQELHKKCGFYPTNEAPMNPWGELEEGRVLYRFTS